MSSSGFAALCSAFGRYDVVHIHAEGPAFFAWLPKLLGKRVVVTIHGIDWQREKWQSGLGSREKITEEQYSYYISELLTLPEKMQKTLEDKERIQWFAAKYANAHDVFFVGRGIDYAVCLEGSLKLKEISYIHSEAYAAGELKHGTISLIEQGTLVIGVLTQSELYEKTISNMLECKSRGAYLMGLTTYGKYEIEDQVNFTVYVPKADEHFVGSLAVIPLQLLGYYVSVAKGLDVDKPRNLAKSVTVE